MTMKIRDRNDFDESGKNNFSSCRRSFSFFEERVIGSSSKKRQNRVDNSPRFVPDIFRYVSTFSFRGRRRILKTRRSFSFARGVWEYRVFSPGEDTRMEWKVWKEKRHAEESIDVPPLEDGLTGESRVDRRRCWGETREDRRDFGRGGKFGRKEF